VCNVQVEVQQRLAAFAAVLASSLSDSEGRVAAHEPLPRLAVSFVAVNLKVSLTLRLHCLLREWCVVLGTHGVLCVGATGVLCVANGVSHMSCQMPNVQDSSSITLLSLSFVQSQRVLGLLLLWHGWLWAWFWWPLMLIHCYTL
jgi:hypothetical protein